MKSRSAVKTKAKKTNNPGQASFGGSLLKNNMEVEAAMEIQQHLDETGVHIVCTIYVCEIFGLLQVCLLKSIYTEQTEYLSYLNCANYVHTGFVQVPLHLHRRLHLHVVLEEAAAERGLVVGLLRLGLDGRLHPGLGTHIANLNFAFLV